MKKLQKLDEKIFQPMEKQELYHVIGATAPTHGTDPHTWTSSGGGTVKDDGADPYTD